MQRSSQNLPERYLPAFQQFIGSNQFQSQSQIGYRHAQLLLRAFLKRQNKEVGLNQWIQNYSSTLQDVGKQPEGMLGVSLKCAKLEYNNISAEVTSLLQQKNNEKQRNHQKYESLKEAYHKLHSSLAELQQNQLINIELRIPQTLQSSNSSAELTRVNAIIGNQMWGLKTKLEQSIKKLEDLEEQMKK